MDFDPETIMAASERSPTLWDYYFARCLQGLLSAGAKGTDEEILKRALQLTIRSLEIRVSLDRNIDAALMGGQSRGRRG